MEEKITGNEVKQAWRRARRVFTLEQKRGFLEEAKQTGSISLICRKHGLTPSMVFEWRRRMEEGALSGLNAGEAVVPVSQVRELNHKISGLERLWGKKTMEIEILKEAVEIGRKKKLISHAPLLGVDGFEDRNHKRPFLNFGKYPALPIGTFLRPNS